MWKNFPLTKLQLPKMGKNHQFKGDNNAMLTVGETQPQNKLFLTDT